MKACPKNHHTEPGENFCATCGAQLVEECNHTIPKGDRFCSECGNPNPVYRKPARAVPTGRGYYLRFDSIETKKAVAAEAKKLGLSLNAHIIGVLKKKN